MPEQTEQPQQLESLPAWDEVAPRFEQAYPDLNPDVMRGQYEQARRMRESRRRLLGAEEDRLAWWARRSAPIGSAVGNLRRSVAYGQAQQRMQAGRPQPEDYDLIAAYEELQVQDREASLGQQIGSGLASIPAVLGEGALAGAAVRGLAGAAPRALGWMAPRQAGAGQLANITARATGRAPGEATSLLGQAVTTTARAIPTAAAMPSMYLDQAAQANIAAGRDPLDIRGLPPAFAVGAMQTAVLGSLSNYANSVPGTSLRAYLQRAATRTGAGVAEQAGVDVLAGMTGLQSGYGLVGDLVDVAQGRPHAAEHALRHAVVQAATFAAFAGLHEAHGRDAVRDRFLETTRELRRQGMSQARAAEMVEGVHAEISRAVEQSPNLSADEAAQLFTDLPERGPLRRYAEQLVSSVLRPGEVQGPLEAAGPQPAQEAAPGRPEPQAAQQAAAAPTEAPQARPEAATPVQPTMPTPQAMSEALDRPQLPGHEATPLTDAQARAAAAEFLRRSPTEAANVAEPRKSEVGTSAPEIGLGEASPRPPHELSPVIERVFPGSQTTRRPGEMRGTIGEKGSPNEKTVYTEYDQGRQIVRVDFESDRPGVGKEARAGSFELARRLVTLAEALHGHGVGIEFRAIDTNRGQFKTPRNELYGRLLGKAGFEQVGGPGIDKAPLYEFRPRREQGPPEKGLVVASVGNDGKTYYGRPGETHGDLAARHPGRFEGVGDQAHGFAGPDGRFLTREEAFNAAQAQRGRVPQQETSHPRGLLGSKELEKLQEQAPLTTEGATSGADRAGRAREALRREGLRDVDFVLIDRALEEHAPEDAIKDLTAGIHGYRDTPALREYVAAAGAAREARPASRERGRPEVSPPTEQQRAAELERLVGQQQREMASEQRSGRGRMPQQARERAPEGELPAELDRRLQESGLTPGQADVMREVLRGASFAEAGRRAGLSGEGARKRAAKALERLRESDPDYWERFQKPQDIVDEIGRHGLDLLSERVATVGHEGQLQDVSLRSEPEAREVSSAPVSEDVAWMVRAADRLGQDPEAYVAERMPELARRVGAEQMREIVRSAQEELGFVREEVSNADRSLRAAGEQPLSPEEVGRAEEHARAEADQQALAEERTQTAQGPADAGAAAGDLRGTAEAGAGGAAPGSEHRKREVESGAPVAGTRAEPVRGPDPVEQLARELVTEEGGFLDPNAFAERVRSTGERIRSSLAEGRDHYREVAGQQAPRTTDFNHDAGIAVTHYNAAGTHAQFATPAMLDKVLGKGYDPQKAQTTFGAYVELRLRWMKEAYRRKAAEHSALAAQARTSGDAEAAKENAKLASENLNKALEVSTLIGGDNSPFATEAEFRAVVGNGPLQTLPDFERALNAPALAETTARWREHMVPEMEKNLREAQGLEVDDPINSFTQIPTFPINLRALKEGDTVTDGTVFTGKMTGGPGGRGNIRNVRLSKLGFARQATGAGKGYETLPAEIIENSLRVGYQGAAKNVMMRALLESGAAVRGKPGERPEVGGETTKKIDFVFRQEPAWADPADAGKENLYVRERSYDEVRRALAPDEPLKFETMRSAFALWTKATLLSTVEALTHFKNQLTFLFRPGVSPIDFVRNFYRVATKDAATMDKVVELARIGAMKAKGPEGKDAGLLWGGERFKLGRYATDPTYWSSRFLDVLQQAMRVTADMAFTKLSEKGGWFSGEKAVENTEFNRTSFINQLGNYNKRSQQKTIALLRDTGIGPFATAGSNYWVQAFRSLTMSPGAKTTSWGAEIALRAEMLLRHAAILAAVPVLNFALHRRLDGDDSTPYGSIHLGRTEEGRGVHLPIFDLTGLGRGFRQTGLMELVNAPSAGRTARQAISRAFLDGVSQPLIHIAQGPAVQFGHTVLTGQDALGRQLTTSRGKDVLDNLLAAVTHMNPAVGSVVGSNPRVQAPLSERLTQLLGPFGPRFRSEVETMNERYYALEEQRHNFEEQRRHGQVFPQEAEYSRLRRFIEAVRELEDATQGIGGHGGARVQGPAPGQEQTIRLRLHRVNLARQALDLPAMPR